MAGIAQSIVKYGVEGGFDAWRRFDNRYVPVAENLQNINIRELMALRSVSEANVDDVFSGGRAYKGVIRNSWQ